MIIAISAEATPPYPVLSSLLAIALALVHLYASRLRFLDCIPRSRWLSAASGVSVAYVFVHILPDLSEQQEVLGEASGALSFIEHHVYLMSLLGLVIFYGLERLVTASRKKQLKMEQEGRAETRVFWVHIAAFAIYNALIGYLLVHREDSGLVSLILFFIALGLHFIVNDYGLWQHHKQIYRKQGRWLLTGAIIVGWLVGMATKIHAAAIAVLFAFLAGGIVLNVLKEELPEERQSCFWAFAAGAGAYTLILIAL
ncbi:MAG: hypothetical protein HC890_03210 [Chloroflexaceae bacterium]|nr:hypothetical protein [Chloroflexaceae bacterium]